MVDIAARLPKLTLTIDPGTMSMLNIAFEIAELGAEEAKNMSILEDATTHTTTYSVADSPVMVIQDNEDGTVTYYDKDARNIGEGDNYGYISYSSVLNSRTVDVIEYPS